MNDLLEELRWRGLLHNSSEIGSLSKRLDKGPVSFYCGFDPTADSLHLGSLQVIMLMSRFMHAGHNAIALIGGGTGLIGDPSGKKEERALKTPEEVKSLSTSMQTQIAKLLEPHGNMAFVNNEAWLTKMSAMEMLRDFGKHFNINEMLKRDSVANRLGDGGMSFTEFTYMLLQAIDFLHLAQEFGCELQLGGSDQWGNMSSGIHLISLKKAGEAHALTAPLILNANGTKFGKSEAGNIWLDANKTSPLQMFQHLVNVEDEQAKVLLRQLTMLSKEEVAAVEASSQDPAQRVIQKAVAFEVVKFVHGSDVAIRTRAESDALFSEDTDSMKPSFHVKEKDEKNWEEIFVETGLVSSKSEARRLASEGGLSVWDTRILDTRSRIDFTSQARNGIMLLVRGKRQRRVIGITN